LTRSPRQTRILVAAATACGLAWLAFASHAAFGLGGAGLDTFFNSWVYNALVLAGAASCLTRAALMREERKAWACMGLGMLAWASGEIYYSAVLSQRAEVPIPSLADAGYLLFYPGSYVALALLVRARMPGFRRSLWLDGAIAALAVSALAAALVFERIMQQSVYGDGWSVATNLAYPIGDLVLLGIVVAVFGLSGWRPGPAWKLIGAGLAAMALADGIYLLQAAEGTYVEGGLLDTLWPVCALLVGFAAWVPSPVRSTRFEFEGLRVVLVPAACGLLAIGLAGATDVTSLGKAPMALSLATLLLVTVRMAWAFRDNQKMLVDSRVEALTDALTGLGNRRSMMAELEEAMLDSTPEDPTLVVLFDLDGFKNYNDSFGHPAGDELLIRLGRRLGAATEPHGSAFRLGGDEFCVLARPREAGREAVIAGASGALTESGEGFTVTSSEGSVLLPGEASTVAEALQLADSRMYAQKGNGRASAGRQTRDVLLSTLRERQPELHAHLADVAVTAVAVAHELDMSMEEVDEVGRAAELHDVGKMAIPDAILNKAGPLDEAEWSFMRRHTIIGERILAAAPALVPVASLVRSSHERWDGDGYPDAMAGEEIPLGARVVAVCDAYDAMVSERPYRAALSPHDALAELRRCAGTQFDSRVVEAFATALQRAKGPVPA
jgi:diguanylate cyclase (GGDEF)-like protein